VPTRSSYRASKASTAARESPSSRTTLAEQVGQTSATVDLDATRAVIGFDPS
jgi:hypothetical protein